jgi:hypothetical protein
MQVYLSVLTYNVQQNHSVIETIVPFNEQQVIATFSIHGFSSLHSSFPKRCNILIVT